MVLTVTVMVVVAARMNVIVLLLMTVKMLTITMPMEFAMTMAIAMVRVLVSAMQLVFWRGCSWCFGGHTCHQQNPKSAACAQRISATSHSNQTDVQQPGVPMKALT